ncbi:GxxExxY protein [Chloroflexota bacterium]
MGAAAPKPPLAIPPPSKLGGILANRVKKVPKLIHPELSYQVRGVLLDVYDALGPRLKEEYYRDAIAVGLEKRRISCQVEESFDVHYEDERVGLYYVDVWIDSGRMLLELKVASAIEPVHKAQAISYLRVTDADLAVVANYGGASLEDERLPNFLRERQPEFARQVQPIAPGLLYPDLVGDIQRVCHRVHLTLGPGFLHHVYRRATMIELRRSGLGYEYIRKLPVEYEGHLLGYQDVRLIAIEHKVLLATFALRTSDDEGQRGLAEQLKARLRRLDLRLRLLANFHDVKLAITPVRVG